MKITGFIFAAGLGTRLYPLTASKPKALVRYNNKTLLDNALEKMSEAGVTDVIVNVHHFPDMMVEALDITRMQRTSTYRTSALTSATPPAASSSPSTFGRTATCCCSTTWTFCRI